MQRSGRLLNLTANQDASATSLGPLFLWSSDWDRLISSFGSHLLSCPKRRGGGGRRRGGGLLSKVSLGKTAERQCSLKAAASGVSLVSQWAVGGPHH